MPPYVIIGITVMTIMFIFFMILLTRIRINSRGMGMRVGMIAMDCPGFWEEMPEDDDDEEYVAFAGLTLPFGSGHPREKEVVTGKVNAYIEARRMGHDVEFNEKIRNPNMSYYADRSYPNSIGVYWAIQKKETFYS